MQRQHYRAVEGEEMKKMTKMMKEGGDAAIRRRPLPPRHRPFRVTSVAGTTAGTIATTIAGTTAGMSGATNAVLVTFRLLRWVFAGE